MKLIQRSVSLILLIMLLLTACAPTAEFPEVTTEQETSGEDARGTESVTETVVPEPVKYYLPTPYVDIEFSADGTIADAMDHVSCEFAAPSKGSVVNGEVSFDDKTYTVPHLYVKEAGGVVHLVYKDFTESAELYRLLENGFTLEAFLVNHNQLVADSTEQCLTASTQSGGYNFSTYKGKYTFSVRTDGAYRSAAYQKQYDTKNLTHLMGVYDPNAQTATLYVNGAPVTTVDAKGLLALATGNCWQTIVLGGDISSSGKAEILASNTRIADYKLYPSVINDGQVTIAYEAAVAKLIGAETDFELIYADPENIPDSAGGIFKTINDSYADVYEPKTDLVSAPTVLQFATEDTISVGSESVRPATIIFDLKLNGIQLYACDADGKELGELKELVKNLEVKVIPAFRINDSKLADYLRTFINANLIGDCFVISKDKDILISVCESTRSARPILDLTAVKDSELAASDAFLKASASGTKTVLVRASALTQENVLAMRSRSLSVFAVLDKTDTVSIHNTVFLGVMGIATKDYKAVISYYESVKDRTQNAPTLLVAHRGDMQNCPENILRSFISAEKSGASVIELDVWLTKDNHLVINHDSTTSKWNQQLKCTESTREQLKKLTLKTGGIEGDEIPFYDEVMEHFSKDGSDIVFIVEIKDKRNAVVDKIMEITKKYGMEGRILIICMDHSIVRYAHETYRVAIQMNQSYPLDKTDAKASLAYACTEVISLHSSYFTTWANSNTQLILLLHHRGIKYSPWNTNSAQDTDNYYSLGYPEFTTNFPHQCDTYARFLKVNADSDGKVKVIRVNYDGTETDVTKDAEFVSISGNVTYNDGKISGQGAYAFRLKTSLPLKSDYQYYIYSQATTK